MVGRTAQSDRMSGGVAGMAGGGRAAQFLVCFRSAMKGGGCMEAIVTFVREHCALECSGLMEGGRIGGARELLCRESRFCFVGRWR